MGRPIPKHVRASALRRRWRNHPPGTLDRAMRPRHAAQIHVGILPRQDLGQVAFPFVQIALPVGVASVHVDAALVDLVTKILGRDPEVFGRRLLAHQHRSQDLAGLSRFVKDFHWCLSIGRNGIGVLAYIAAGSLPSQRSALRSSTSSVLVLSASACALIAAACASPCSWIALASAVALRSRASASPRAFSRAAFASPSARILTISAVFSACWR